MTPSAEAAFLEPFTEAGDIGGILEVGPIHKALCTHVGRQVALSTAYDLLHRHGWRKIMPRSRHPKTDQEAQASFKKNWPDIVALAYEKACAAGRPLRIFFQDEARFGRINDPRKCWARSGVRPIVGKQIVREYTYAYGAFCPQDGASVHYVLPAMNGQCMSFFSPPCPRRIPRRLYPDGLRRCPLPQPRRFGRSGSHDAGNPPALFPGTQPFGEYLG